MIGFVIQNAAHRARIAAHLGLLHLVGRVLRLGARFSGALAWAETFARAGIDNTIHELRAQRHQGI